MSDSVCFKQVSRPKKKKKKNLGSPLGQANADIDNPVYED